MLINAYIIYIIVIIIVDYIIIRCTSTSTTDDGQCMTACESMNCLNEDEKYWVECTTCSSWYHCSCVNVLWEEVREESYNFFCFKCSLI